LVSASICLGDSIQGSYVEVRSGGASDLREGHSTRAVLAWQVRQGIYDGEKLDGQTVVAFVTLLASPGGEVGQTKTIFVVDKRATPSQEKALVHLAKDLAPEVIHDAGQTVRSNLDVRIAEGCGCGAAVVDCDLAKVRTRRQTDADQAAAGDPKPANPLGDVFSSVTAVATQYQCVAEQIEDPATNVIAFTGSFSR
jgi:hypothetical protein